ncbi:exodeoxyribonuclease V subunit gamma [Acinetobacter sp. V91_7]|uniref:exodeoxyribonuclease V subunit gamma n=1 Tax=unclassified Acinetobacter TaxID=196816 RepID=UPI00287E521F|nr:MULTISPECIES: exodeoxyribonuclease V subunit gamma [unclassified Acinetobacter]MDS7932366.1 exodeoxyribonuclease V subunit gamma [Acinetobacter sp. V91_4B]MDS7961764.1 exodeoxyribonuclease V subunit gamma [Acinetobacter sp. V91_7]MDS8028266.1 exodeoxyribonuclease V subunit gamma [Acinetobacter sp. V91_13]
MGIHVIQSQRIDVLLQGVLASTSQTSTHPLQVLKTQHFVVPSPAVEQWLIQKLAEQQGMSANYQFHQRVRGFQWYAYQQVLTAHKEQVRKANIPRLIFKWRVHQTLYEFIQPDAISIDTSHPLHSIVQRIYDSADRLEQGIDKQLKKQKMLYWVAEQVADLFSNYMIYRGQCQRGCENSCTCPENWLAAWGQGRALDIEKYIVQKDEEVTAFALHQTQELERWQRWLWQQHFHDDFLQMQQIDALFWQEIEHPDRSKWAISRLPHQVVIFTLLDLPPSQLQFLRRLGQYIDVLILHYNPSQEYWADSVDPLWKQRYDLGVKERFIAKNPKATDAEISDFFNKFTLNFNAEARESRHPLLTRLGKQARDHFSLLSNLSTGEEGKWVDAFVDDFPESLLGKVQSDILHLVEPQAKQYGLAPDDDSIQIHVCHSTLRQLEVLKEQLIGWLAQTHEQPRRPNDILVLVPNLTDIEPLIRSVFPATATEQGVHLPVKIAGVASLDALNAWRAVIGRIQLMQGRFSFDDFADWLSLHATQQRYELEYAQVERILNLLADAGFKRGLDAEHLKRSLCEGDDDYRYSFKFALERLALGIAVPVHETFNQVLSYAKVQPGDFELIGTLIQIYQDLNERRDWLTLHEQGQVYTVEYWLQVLGKDIVEFEQVGVAALKAVREIVKKQERMLTLASYYAETETGTLRKITLPLPYIIEEIQRTLESQSAQAEPTGQITFAQIGHIRPLPYRLMVMLNLDAGQFPNRDTHVPFDLMDALRQQLGDRSRLEDDQGAFLDALLLAQENLWLFYNGFDVNDGEVREPSSILQEFREHLALIVKAEDDVPESVVIEGIEIPSQLKQLYHLHDLQPFDPKGFSVEKSGVRYQDHWFKVASQIQQVSGNRQPWANTTYPLQAPDMLVLDSQQWIQDVTFPARLYLKTLGVENLGSVGLLDQNEPLLLDGLGRYAIRHFLQQSDQQAQPEVLLDQLPVGKVKYSAWQQGVFEQECLLERLHQYAPAVTQTTQRVWRIAKQLHMNITVPKSENQDWISMEPSSARAKRRAKVWLEYLLWLAYLNEGSVGAEKRRIVVFSDQTVICSGVSSEQARQYLQPWFKIWRYAQQQPLVLPAALLLKPLEKAKAYQWETADQAEKAKLDEKSYAELLKYWNETGSFTTMDMTQNEACKLHKDWSFILQEQDAQALLQHACDEFAYDLYHPVFQFQHSE